MKDNKTNELRAQLKQTFLEWCKDSKCHGVLNIVKTQNRILKSIWIVSFLACSAACIYLISETIVNYLNNPISTKIEVIDDSPATFPTISICMLNPLDSENELVKSRVDRIIDSLAVSLETNHLAVYQTAATLQINDFLSNLNRSEQLFYGNTIEKSMYYCKFNTRVCFSDVFQWYFDFYLGNCYKFNPNGTLKVGKSGIKPGLQLQFVIPNGYSSFFNYGMRILIHNSSLSNPYVYDSGISLAPGFSYDIKVSRTYYNRLDAPYSNCLKDLTRNSPKKTFFMEIMFNELNISTYDQKYCQNLIFQWILQTNCSCVNPAYPYYDLSIPKCLNTAQIRCQNSMFEEAYNNPDLYFGEDCPKECDYFDYNIEMSQAAFPSEWLFENLTRWKFLPDAVRSRVARIDSYEESRKHFISFNIYYDQLVYQLIKEDPYWDAVLLLSNFGGSLGLFVGMSILTFVELIELIFQFVEFTILDHLNRRKIRAQANKASENTESE